jgi:hypothetical protein
MPEPVGVTAEKAVRGTGRWTPSFGPRNGTAKKVSLVEVMGEDLADATRLGQRK